MKRYPNTVLIAFAKRHPATAEYAFGERSGGYIIPSHMQTKHITVTLTHAEAANLLLAASQCLGHEDAEQATFQHKSHRDAAYRAHDKIRAALAPSKEYPIQYNGPVAPIE